MHIYQGFDSFLVFDAVFAGRPTRA